MNCLMATPDRSAHLEIDVVACLCSTALLLTAIMVHRSFTVRDKSTRSIIS